MLHHQFRQLRHLAHFARNADVPAVAVHQDVASGDGHVFGLYGLSDVAKADAQGLHLLHVQTNRNFPSVHAPDVHLADLRKVFNFFLQILRVLIELRWGVVSR